MRRLVLIALLLSRPAFAQKVDPAFASSGIADWTKPPAPTKEPTFKPPVVKRMKLANGMALLVSTNKALPIVSMSLIVPGAGAAADPAGKGGVAAFTADLLDEGTQGLSALAIAQELDRLGAGFGAGAGTDAAEVSMSTLSKTLDESLALFTKLVTAPAFEDKEAERVKGDRVTSLELRRDRPREVAAIMLNAALYGATSPYGHPAAGTREEFKGITVADAKAFYAERYNPKAMTLIVAGNVDAAALKAKLDVGLGAWKPAGAKPPAKLVATPEKAVARLLVADRANAAQSDVRIGLVGLARKDPRFFKFEVFRTVLGDGFTSRLTQRLREQLGIVYNIRASQEWRVATGPFVIASAIATPETGKGLTEVMKIVDDLATVDVPAAELDKAKQNLIRALPAQFETNAGVVGSYAALVLHGLPDNWYATYAANIRKVRAADVKAVAKAVSPSKKLVFSVVGDLSKIKADLDKLGLGESVAHDLYGVRR
ncbi:MAG TPA: pitrilysin family protein [Kofleriaceae bacterium]|nr:pitrilysin family protein [Kofleriaceae bacterium]